MRSYKPIFLFIFFFSFVSQIDANAFSETGLQHKIINDPYTPYLNSIPQVLETLSTEHSGTGTEAITTKKILFSSKDNTNKVFAIMSYPQKAGKYPALLVLHGGGENAQRYQPLLEKFARKGYVTLTLDMPGICGTNNTPNSSGPWKSRKGVEEPRFDIEADIKNSVLVDSEVAGIEAFNLLCAQPNVDTRNVGITGFSWGGYSTTMLAGLLGNKVKAAYAVWGCGFYDKGSFWTNIIAKLPETVRTNWLTYFDAGRRAKNIKGSYFIEGAANDTYFWPEAVSATLKAVPGMKNHVWGPNVNHKQDSTGVKMQELFMDYHLRLTGSPFIQAEISDVKSQKDNSKLVTILLKVPRGVKPESVQLMYSEPAANWQTREWKPISAGLQKGKAYTVTIPAELVNKKVNFYAYVTDSRGVVTSSYMY